MTTWTLTAAALLPPLLVAVFATGRGALAGRLAGVQLAGSLGVLIMLSLTFADDQPSSIDLALCMALLSLPSALLFALFQERWL